MPPTFWSRLWEKTKKDPLIPIGCTATLGCLTAGLYAFKSGEKHLSQRMMRARVMAQGFTIAVLMAGSFYSSMQIKGQDEPSGKGLYIKQQARTTMPGGENPFATQGGAGGGPGSARKTPSPPRAPSEPSWLKSSSAKATPAAAAAPSAVPMQAVPQTAAQAVNQAQAAQQPDGQTPQLVIYMRVANFGLCILMCAAAILTVIVPAGATPASWVLAFYVLAFSCLLCCFEFNLRQVAKHIASNFGFLYNAQSRACFLVFVGVLCFSLGITGKIAGACMIVNAIFNSIVLCKYPQYATNAPTTTAQQEGWKFLQRNPNVARKVGGAVVNASLQSQAGGGGGAAGGAASSSWI